MADLPVNLVLDRLIPFLKEEAKLLGGLHGEAEGIRRELLSISMFIQDADARAEREAESSNNVVRSWVEELREAAYSIEDAIDEYMVYTAKYRDGHGFKAFLKKIAWLVASVIKRRKMVLKMQELKLTVKEIGERGGRYGFNRQGGSSSGGTATGLQDPRAGLHFVEDNTLVGIEDSKNELVEKLIDGSAKRVVISLVGMGGMGKSTLARKVYDDQTVKGHFKNCQAWITVSRSYNMAERLRTMIRCFYEANNEHPPHGIDAIQDEVELIGKSREYLNGKKYGVVFDDVWNGEFWRQMELALPEYDNGSRVIITTRNVAVANFCKESSLVHVHDMKPLSLEKAQELLCGRAFRFDEQKQCPPELNDLSLDIVKKCERLPLAIVTIGGLLLTKDNEVSEWESVCNNLSTQFGSNPHLTHVRKILSFSYLDLPHYLKACCLCLGMFPHNYSIRKRRLLRLWIAKGLVKEKPEMTLEEVAEEYLTMLIHRSFVQFEYGDSTGRIRNLRVHDMMLEFLLSTLEELNLIPSSQVDLASTRRSARYLSISDASTLSTSNGNFQTHSIIFFSIEVLPSSLFATLSLNFKLLKEIDFKGAPLFHRPEELWNLLHLRYLSLEIQK